MISRLVQIFSDSSTKVRSKLFGIYGVLIAINILAWVWAMIAFRAHPVLLGTALLAYGFGLRHAVDADHIAAIDNVTRKLMQEKKRPVTVGFFFSLGHSSVVVLVSVAVAATASVMQARFDHYKEIGGIVGTLVSALVPVRDRAHEPGHPAGHLSGVAQCQARRRLPGRRLRPAARRPRLSRAALSPPCSA